VNINKSKIHFIDNFNCFFKGINATSWWKQITTGWLMLVCLMEWISISQRYILKANHNWGVAWLNILKVNINKSKIHFIDNFNCFFKGINATSWWKQITTVDYGGAPALVVNINKSKIHFIDNFNCFFKGINATSWWKQITTLWRLNICKRWVNINKSKIHFIDNFNCFFKGINATSWWKQIKNNEPNSIKIIGY
jgi:hypothetical protein